MMKKVLQLLIVLTVSLSLGMVSCSLPFAQEDDSDPRGEWTYVDEFDCFARLGVVYCDNPLDTELQSMNIYVPEEYLLLDGNVNPFGRVGKYTALTAPIVYQNGVGGYAESKPREMSVSDYIDAGMIWVSPGCRGRQSVDSEGTEFIGKSPAGLVDLKAGIRYLKHFDDDLPGNSYKIVSVGGSAGGAMSSLLGSTGNSRDYKAFLDGIGAKRAPDDVYAAMCYCPIIDLDHADLAYEWMFGGDLTPTGGMGHSGDPLSEFQQALSGDLAEKYISYINDRFGRTVLSSARSGVLYDMLMDTLEDAATVFFKKLSGGELTASYDTTDPAAYISGNYQVYNARNKTWSQGVAHSWLSWDGFSASIAGGLDALIDDVYLSRMKSCPSFDIFANNSAENQVFGDSTMDYTHFAESLADILADNDTEYSSLDGYVNYVLEYAPALTDPDLQDRVYMINPMNYVGKCDSAPYFRIRVGTVDNHTSFSIATALALKLESDHGVRDVDYAMVWDAGHGSADYAGEFVDWIEDICH